MILSPTFCPSCWFLSDTNILTTHDFIELRFFCGKKHDVLAILHRFEGGMGLILTSVFLGVHNTYSNTLAQGLLSQDPCLTTPTEQKRFKIFRSISSLHFSITLPIHWSTHFFQILGLKIHKIGVNLSPDFSRKQFEKKNKLKRGVVKTLPNNLFQYNWPCFLKADILVSEFILILSHLSFFWYPQITKHFPPHGGCAYLFRVKTNINWQMFTFNFVRVESQYAKYVSLITPITKKLNVSWHAKKVAPQQFEKLRVLPIRVRGGRQRPETLNQVPQGSTQVPFCKVSRQGSKF